MARDVAAGDRAAFDAFFKEYFPRLFRFTLTRVDNDPALAEEVVQRTMCIVVRKMGSYRGEALLFTWLCQICRNEMSAGLPARCTGRAALESIGADEYRPEAVQQKDEIARFVHTTLQHLPARYARALEMKYVNGNSVQEIALELELSEKATESLLTRARKAFKDGFSTLWDFEPSFVID